MKKKEDIAYRNSFNYYYINLSNNIFYVKKNIKDIPNDYIAVFHGGAGEMTYSTYIYKIDNNHENYGFKYINTTRMTKSWGSTEAETKITKRGEFDWKDGAFIIAKKNNAYDYVKLPNSKKIYSIEEFKSMFMMN